MRWTALALAATTLLLFLTGTAHADPIGPVVVVEIAGDIEDAEGLRDSIGNELRATVVLPDDPRASSARGTLTIEARGEDRRMSATYRSLGTPVSRTVDLPADPRRARSVAVLLAGNVAREEADELLASRPGAGPAAPVPAGAVAPVASDEELRRLRGVVGGLATHVGARRTAVGVTMLIEGGLGIGAGTVFVLQRGEGRKYTRAAGASLLGIGVANVLVGALVLTSRGQNDYEVLRTEVDQGTDPKEIVRRVEAKWEELAASDRTARKTWGWVGVVTGGIVAGAGLALPAVVPADAQGKYFSYASWALALYGGLILTSAINTLFTPTSLEQTWLTYRATKPTVLSTSAKGTGSSAKQTELGRPRLGFAPTSGGGSVTFGFTF